MSLPEYGPRFPASRMGTSCDWDDLVLAPQTLLHIEEIKTWIAHREQLTGNMAAIERINRHQVHDAPIDIHPKKNFRRRREDF